MKWIGKSPPLYVREGDEWWDEINKICYECDIKNRIWWQTGRPTIPFPPKTKVIFDRRQQGRTFLGTTVV